MTLYLFQYLIQIVYIISLLKGFVTLSSSETTKSLFGSFINFTNAEISYLLRKHGYAIVENPGGVPWARLGDILYPAAMVLPELAHAMERSPTIAVATKQLWIDGHGNAEVFYYFDTKNRIQQGNLVPESIKSWTDHTCLKFTRMTDSGCVRRVSHGAICLTNDGKNHCASSVGNLFPVRKGNQMLIVGPVCDKWQITKQFGHALGFAELVGRADRDKFVTVNYHNYEVTLGSPASPDTSLKTRWLQGRKCDADGFQTSAPMPYDYFSAMGSGEADYSDEDSRAAFVTKDPRYQYILDYAPSAGYPPSSLDLYLINTIYGCIKKWSASCTSTPKCKNFGFVQKSCTCHCPQGFTGSLCERMIDGLWGGVEGAMFPPQDKAKAMIEVDGDGQYNFKNKGMHLENKNYGTAVFKFYQYATMYLKGPDKTTTATVSVFETGTVTQVKLSGHKFSDILQHISNEDCIYGMRFYWGNFEQGKIRTECSSTFVTNEPNSNALMLRAKTNVIGIVIIGKQGQWLQSAELTKYMIEMLQFNVRFVTRPQSKLKVLPNNDGKDSTNTTGTGTADGNTTVVGTDAAGASKLKLDEGDEMSIAFYGLLLLLVLGACCAVLCLRSKRNKSETPSLDESSPEEESPMPSGSDSSGDDD